MKKTKEIIILLVIALLLSACQPTPEKEIVGNKNDGAMESAIQEGISTSPLAQIIDNPKTYKNVLTKENVTVNIDADVQVISSNIFPVWTTRKYQLTQADVDKIAGGLIPKGAKIYDMEAQYNTLTKSEIQDQIINWKSIIEEIKHMDDTIFHSQYDGSKESVIEGYNNKIKEYEEMYDDAPDEEPIYENRLSFKDTANGKKIAVFINSDSNSEHPVIFSVSKDRVDYGYGYDSLAVYALRVENPIAQDSQMMQLTLKGAKKEAALALKSMGIGNMIVASSGLIESTKQNEAYFIRFERVLDDEYIIRNIQTAQTSDTAVGADGTEQNNPNEESVYSVPLEPEEMILVLNEDGITDFYWYNAIGDFNMVTSNVKLLSFDEIVKKAENNMFYKTYIEKNLSLTININKIVLSYMCVKKQNSNDTLMVIPVWDFIGNQSFSDFSGTHEQTDRSYMTINAIDGSIIDRSLGY